MYTRIPRATLLAETLGEKLIRNWVNTLYIYKIKTSLKADCLYIKGKISITLII